MNTGNTSSGAYTAIFHSPSAYDAQSGRLWHLSVHGILKNIHARTLESLSELLNASRI